MVVFVIIAAFLLVAFLGWLLYSLSQRDISKMYRWALYLYSVILPITCFMWIYESIHIGEWFNAKINDSEFTFFLNVLIFAMLSVCWLLICRLRNKKLRKYWKYGITYDYNLDARRENAEGRFVTLLVLCLIVFPGLDIYFIVEFIKNYLI